MNEDNKRDTLTLIRITENSRNALRGLAKDKKLKMVTVLEYILKGEIAYKDLTKYYYENQRINSRRFMQALWREDCFSRISI